MKIKLPLFTIFLFLLACVYRFGSLIHKKKLLKQRIDTISFTPMICIGGLRTGGDHKTPMTQHLAQAFCSEGLHVAVLVYSIYTPLKNGYIQITESDTHPYVSDEALLLKKYSRCDVFGCRDRYSAWRELSKLSYDLILSDGGIEDPRLRNAYTICLQKSPFPLHMRDIFPSGLYRSFLSDHPEINEIWQDASLVPLKSSQPHYTFTSHIASIHNFYGEVLSPMMPTQVILSIARPSELIYFLNSHGVSVSGTQFYPDHYPSLEKKIRLFLKKHPDIQLLITRKDSIKLSPEIMQIRSLFVIDLAITLSRDVHDLFTCASRTTELQRVSAHS